MFKNTLIQNIIFMESIQKGYNKGLKIRVKFIGFVILLKCMI